MPEEYRAYLLCTLFGWTFDEYLDTSAMFCDDALAFRALEQEHANRRR